MSDELDAAWKRFAAGRLLVRSLPNGDDPVLDAHLVYADVLDAEYTDDNDALCLDRF